MELCGVRRDQLPDLYESYDVVGTLKPEVASELGFPEQVKIIAGAGDNAAAAVGTGTVGAGDATSLWAPRYPVYLQRPLRGGPPQRSARLRPRRRLLPPDGLHALRCQLTTSVDG